MPYVNTATQNCNQPKKDTSVQELSRTDVTDQSSCLSRKTREIVIQRHRVIGVKTQIPAPLDSPKIPIRPLRSFASTGFLSDVFGIRS